MKRDENYFHHIHVFLKYNQFLTNSFEPNPKKMKEMLQQPKTIDRKKEHNKISQ